MKVICEICNEYIAQVENGDVTVPMTGRMFKTPDSYHGYDPPFLPDTTWEDMRCGYCNQRPFTERDGFLTDGGYITVKPIEIMPVTEVDSPVADEPVIHKCDVCGKVCKTGPALRGHMSIHAQKAVTT